MSVPPKCYCWSQVWTKTNCGRQQRWTLARSSPLKFFLFYSLFCLTRTPLLKFTIRNGRNERKNQRQLFEVRGQVRGSMARLLCLAGLLRWGPLLGSLKVVIGTPRVHLWVTLARRATSWFTAPPSCRASPQETKIGKSRWPRLHTQLT